MATNWTNITSPETFLQIANDNTSGYFWASMLFMLSTVLLISMLPFGFEAALLAAAFAALMVGIPMVYLGLVSWTWVVVYAGVIVTMILWIMYSQKN
jgi:hypothetical protein